MTRLRTCRMCLVPSPHDFALRNACEHLDTKAGAKTALGSLDPLLEIGHISLSTWSFPDR